MKTMFKKITLLLISFIFIESAFSEDYKLRKAGMSSERLDRLYEEFKQDTDQNKIPGFVAMIMRKGQLAQFKAYGYADIENKIPLQKDSIFRIYSMTKPVTGVALMILIEEGKLSLDDPVKKYIPAFGQTKVYKKMVDNEVVTESLIRDITIRDLATHTSGLSYAINDPDPVSNLYRERKIFPYYYPNQEGGFEGAKSYEDICAFSSSVAEIPLKHQPGTQWTYSIGMDILGCVIEKASKLPFDKFLRQKIFDPLNMNDTAFMVPEDKKHRYTSLYGFAPILRSFIPEMADSIDPKALTELLVQRDECPYLMESVVFDGGSGLVSTAEDYMKFAQMLLKNGKAGNTRVLGRKSIELLSSNHLSEEITSQKQYPRGKGFGITVGVTLDPGLAGEYGSKGNFYWGGAASTTFWVDPKEELTALFMTQLLVNPHGTGDKFRTLVYQAIED